MLGEPASQAVYGYPEVITNPRNEIHTEIAIQRSGAGIETDFALAFQVPRVLRPGLIAKTPKEDSASWGTADVIEIGYDLCMGLAGISAMPIAVAAALLGAPLAAQTRPSDANPKRLIEKADRLAWLYNWYTAGPLYAEAEKIFEQAGDRRNALYAKIGRIRSEWESMSFREVSEYLATELESDLVQSDEELRLWLKLRTSSAVSIKRVDGQFRLGTCCGLASITCETRLVKFELRQNIQS